MHRITRRNVITTIAGTGGAMMCPALLNAQQSVDWGDVPTTAPQGQSQLIEAPAGPVSVDVTDLMPGEVAVIARPSDSADYSATGNIQYVAVHRRTDAQIAFGEANDRDGTVQDPRYFVVNLVCTHRGKAIGFTGNPDAPFACTDRGGRHSSDYSASGLGVAGASEGEYLSVPPYTLDASGSSVVISLS
ncbi:MAG: hypothetical protein AAFN59_13135 [Pseudomonadota bacterium]